MQGGDVDAPQVSRRGVSQIVSSDAIVDVEVDVTAARRTTLRRVLRYGLPLACVVLIVGGLIASALYTRAINRDDVLSLTNDFVAALDEQVQADVRAYLLPADRAVANLGAVAADEPFSLAGRQRFERLAAAQLDALPQLSAVYVGHLDGRFMLVKRNARGSTDTKLVTPTADGPRTTWARRDERGTVTAVEADEAERYDPRTRNWYGGAETADGVSWTRVYVFFTDKVPGITASLAVRDESGAIAAIVGADIYLDSLSQLLAKLEQRARGTLAIVSHDGDMVAYRDAAATVHETADGLRPKKIAELGLPNLAEAYERLRVNGPGRALVSIDGQSYMFAASSLQGAVSRDWWLMLLAPESAYLGFVASNSQRGLIAASGIVVLAIILSGFLAYQGIAAERNTRAVAQARVRLQAQRRVFHDLANLSNLTDPSIESDLQRAAELLAQAEGARRVSFWRFSGDGDSLICINAYDVETSSHTSGAILPASEAGDILDRIAVGETVELDTSGSGPGLGYLSAVGTTTMSSTPVKLVGHVFGAIWVEDAGHGPALADDDSLPRAMANLLAPRLRRMAEAEAAARPDPRQAAEAREARLAALRERVASMPEGGGLRHTSIIDVRKERDAYDTAEASGARVHTDMTVLVLTILDDRIAARGPSTETGQSLFCDIVDRIETAAAVHDIPYVKVLSDRVLAVSGFRDDASGAAARMVDVALDVREACAALFLAASQPAHFAIGIDSGSVFGVAVGGDEDVYNVWGEAVRVASTLAETAEPGTIQVSETTYELTREHCVFRRRGAFYLDWLGEMTTYALRGRL